ncbi:hypothetical protein [Streptosporangium sp. NPDC049078]|uniref:hypothetical protein n=1 Tax=Streptosporangium sp. NPDC049078 TaxID=3155767 RepID=UPI00343D5613
MTAPFTVPDDVNQLIREHLVCPAQIADRAGVNHPAVSNWLDRHRSLAELAVTHVAGRPLFWWPQFEAALAELGLPDPQAVEVQRRRAERRAA